MHFAAAAPRSACARLLAAAIAVAAIAVPARAEEVALTFDDLPTLALSDSTPYAEVTTRRLLAGLRRHHFPAIGFVVGDKLEGPDREARLALLSRWLDAGMQLGNHTYSHGGLNKTGAGLYIADVDRDDALLRPLLATRRQAPRWFRHPYLETGATPEVQQSVEAWLQAHGYGVAKVTMENSDYLFALPYDDAVARGDRAEAERVRRAYLDYTAKVVPWYRGAALALLGRRPAFVFLLHATRLNADCIDDLAAVLHDNALRVVSLERAMADPAYGLPDDEADPEGDEWLTRWSQALHKNLPWESFPEPPADIVAENDRLDTAP